MLNKIVIVACCVLVVGCGQQSKDVRIDGTMCLNGVKYYKIDIGKAHDVISPVFNRLSTVDTCYEETQK